MNYQLYKTNIDIQKFLSEAIDDNGEIVNENSLTLYENSVEKRNELLINLALEAKNMQGYIENLTEEKKSLEDRILKAEKKLNYIYKTLTQSLEENLIAPKVEVTFRKSSYVELDNVELDQIDEKYINVKVETKKTISKERIENDLKNGINIPYARIKERKNIKIK